MSERQCPDCAGEGRFQVREQTGEVSREMAQDGGDLSLQGQPIFENVAYPCPRCGGGGVIEGETIAPAAGSGEGGQSKLSERNATAGDAPLATVPPSAPDAIATIRCLRQRLGFEEKGNGIGLTVPEWDALDAAIAALRATASGEGSVEGEVRWLRSDGQSRASRARHPDRERARAITRNAVLRGDLIPGPCYAEGHECSGGIESHHPDYSKPLLVVWTCRGHHRTLDRQRGENMLHWAETRRRAS